MYCPNCRSEFRQEITSCPDCEISLVVELPPQPEFSEDDLVQVFEATNVAVLPVVKSLLRSAEIPFLVQGDEAMSVLPVGNMGLGPLTNKGHGLAALVLVPKDREEEARALLTELPDVDDYVTDTPTTPE